VPDGHPDDIDLNARGHFGVLALPIANRQSSVGLRPSQWDDSSRTFFVVIAVSRVLVQIERAVGSLVNPKLDGPPGFSLVYSISGPKGMIEPART
jgi:hypothetical protein